jgi:pullulanase/glycogen debranching enzyme
MPLEELFHIKQRLGAVQADGGENSGRVQFRLYFPVGFDTQISGIRVAGDFQPQIGAAPWNFAAGPSLTKTATAEGDLWTLLLPTVLAKGFYQYKYEVTFTDGTVRKVTDPCARYSGSEQQNSGFVIGGSRPEDNVVAPLATRKPLRDLVVYELHADDFTDDFRGTRAPFDAIVDKLDHLVTLGVNAILFMPWTAWRDKSYDWGYVPFQYLAVEYAYANDLNRPEEKISWLKRLISACHERGIHAIMDGVFNHCSTDFPYKDFYRDQATCPYTAGPFGGEFAGLQDLDFNNQCTQDFIRDVCLYWISVFEIDGIRFDNTTNYYVAGSILGLPGLLGSIESYVNATGRQNFSMTLEHLRLDAAAVVNASAATSYWDNALFGHCFDHLWSGEIRPGYLAALNNTQYVTGPDKVATAYLSNHDHSSVVWQAGARTNEGSRKWYRTQPHAIALLTGAGTPMIANGQEFSEDYWIPEDDQGSGRRVRPRPLRWKAVHDAFGAPMLRLYSQLCRMRHGHPALRSRHFHPPKWEDWQTQFDQDGFGVDTARRLVVYHRWDAADRFIIALNFSDQDHFVTLPFSVDGAWEDLLSGLSVNVTGFRLGVTLTSNWGRVFMKR